MKIYLPCMVCAHSPASRTTYSCVDVTDSNIYRLKCKFGHQSTMTIQDPKYLVLLHVATHAIVDGYYREAIMSFYSCLERFWSLYVDVVAHSRGVQEREMIAFRKRVHLSERELGAYHMAHLLDRLTPAPDTPGKIVSTRNDVAHKGVIPNKEEAIRYGNLILQHARPILEQLRQSKQQDLVEFVARYAIAAEAQAQQNSFTRSDWPYLGTTRLSSWGKYLDPLSPDLGGDIELEIDKIREQRELWKASDMI